jgi:hypothetical protein
MTKSFSRTSVDLFCECPRCFYLSQCKGIKRPPGYPFTLNGAVDKLAKAEFDALRKTQTPHPIMKPLGLVPLKHSDIDMWRNNRKGIQYMYNGFLFYGAIDDVWQQTTEPGLWHVVDYKATAKKDAVTTLDPKAAHHVSYQRQISFYTWLFAQNSHPVSKTAYFYYATGDNTLPSFGATLHFRTHLIAYECDFSWIEPTLDALIACYNGEEIPEPSEKCAHCKYVASNIQLK